MVAGRTSSGGVPSDQFAPSNQFPEAVVFRWSVAAAWRLALGVSDSYVWFPYSNDYVNLKR